jgi:hypothetical protein
MGDKIPIAFKKYFWDYEFSDLNLNEYGLIITERILNYGNLESIKWLLRRIDTAFLKEVVKNGRYLDKKTKNFWSIYLNEI